ncbi:cation-binding protein, partial [Paraburkholderia hospita]
MNTQDKKSRPTDAPAAPAAIALLKADHRAVEKIFA